MTNDEEIFEIPPADPLTQKRSQIDLAAGDLHALHGTTNDLATLTRHDLARLIVGLSDAQSLADVRAAATPLAPLAQALLDGVEDGSVRLPALEKGAADVQVEFTTRATAIADVLSGSDQ